MAENRKHHDEALAAGVSELNDKIASAAALEDARFSKTVKDLDAAKKKAREDVMDARKMMLAGIAQAKETAKAAEQAMNDQVQKVSQQIISDKAAQLRVNEKVAAEMKRLEKFSNDAHTENKKARGVIKKIMEENKKAAAEEVAALFKAGDKALTAAGSALNANLAEFKSDLTDATEELYGDLNAFDKETMGVIAGAEATLKTKKAAVAAKLASAEKTFGSKLNSLANAITANAKWYEGKMKDVTGVVYDWKKAAGADRKAIEMERNAIVAKQQKAIARAVSLGETKRAVIERTAMENISIEKKSLLTTISAAVENMADNVFATVQGNRQKIADNYLSLKAYTAVAADLIADYLQKGKTRNLSAIGDLLETVSGVSHVKTAPAEGEGFGGDTIPNVFSGDTVKVDNAISKVNGLVNEYVATIGQIKQRWPMGLGKYLLSKLETAMQGSGALEVDKVEDKSGNFVFINAHAVGLSSRLADFQGLAARMTHYEHALAELTGKLTTKKTAGKMTVGPPEWQGN